MGEEHAPLRLTASDPHESDKVELTKQYDPLRRRAATRSSPRGDDRATGSTVTFTKTFTDEDVQRFIAITAGVTGRDRGYLEWERIHLVGNLLTRCARRLVSHEG